jgi:hypothetical protein
LSCIALRDILLELDIQIGNLSPPEFLEGQMVGV